MYAKSNKCSLSYHSGKPERTYFAAWYILLRFLVISFVGYFNSILAFQAVGFTMMAGVISLIRTVFTTHVQQPEILQF